MDRKYIQLLQKMARDLVEIKMQLSEIEDKLDNIDARNR